MTDPWLAAFHAGDRRAMEQCYRDHYPTVATAAGRVLSSADAETVTHEVFYRLLSDGRLRENFVGGSLAAWLTRVATNSALDYLRKHRRERFGLSHDDTNAEREAARCADEELEAKMLVEKFRRECLPPEWLGVFEARFLRQVTQRKAAEELGMRRTTLVYQEHRIRGLLTRFLLRRDLP
jgi:RNA polymerase sigma-70 factor, ECF subfamily